MTQRWTLVLVAACSWSAGCGSVAPPPPAPSPAPAAAPLPPDLEAQKQVALAARDAMAGQLLGKLMETLGSAGPAAAIGVCRQDAPQIAADTGKKFGVAIGRTSFRLRNPKNAPPAWADPLVAAQPADPQFLPLPDGQLGALLPIRLKPECMLCHGPKDQILTEVREALATHYPADQATGFQTGDLRGWFWVTVPAGARSPGTNAPTSANEKL